MEDRPMERKSSSFPQEVAHLCPGDCQGHPQHNPQRQILYHLISFPFLPITWSPMLEYEALRVC